VKSTYTKDECILQERMGNFHWRQRSRESTEQKKVEDIYIVSRRKAMSGATAYSMDWNMVHNQSLSLEEYT
jgi:hypothetical protein